MRRTIRPLGLVTLSAFVATLPLLVAQTAPTASATSGSAPANRVPTSTQVNRPAPAGAPQAAEGADETLLLSPFQVVAEQDTGYQATSTLAGTRLRSELRDIPASISVVTKDFMNDVNATDLTSLLVYTLGTEVGGVGGNFSNTIDFGGVYDDATAEPTTGTRVRGLTRADTTRDFFLTDIPLDTAFVDRVEVSRGPNSMLFGLGSPAGIVNYGLLKSDLRRQKTSVSGSYGSYGSTRLVLDHNQPLFRDKLSLRLATSLDRARYRQEEAFENKKAAHLTTTYAPFKNTVLRANTEWGKSDAVRPENRPPFDEYTLWWNLGKPVWDPVTGRGRLLATPAPGYPNAFLPDGTRASVGGSTANAIANGIGAFNSNIPALFYSDPNSAAAGIPGRPYEGIKGFATGAYPPATGTALVNGGMAGVQSMSTYLRNVVYVNHPGRNAFNAPQITDPSIFDFYRHMLYGGGTKYEYSEWKTFNVSLEQMFLDRRAGIEAVFDRQAIDFGHVSPGEYAIRVDINERLPDGTPNPNFGRPLAVNTAFTRDRASDRMATRFTGFYNLDLRKTGPDWLGKFLGTHQFNANYMRQEAFAEVYGGMALNVDTDYSTSEGLGVSTLSSTGRALYRVHYLGNSVLNAPTPQGTMVGSIQANQTPTTNSMTLLYNRRPTTGQTTPSPWQAQQFGLLANEREDVRATSRNSYLSRTEFHVHSTAAVLQSHWLNRSVVTTGGWRRDDVWTYDAGVAPQDPATGRGVDDWSVFYPRLRSNIREESKNFGVVVHSPQRVNRLLPWGTRLSAVYNESSNFRVAGQRYDITGAALGQEIGDTKEYGLRLSTLEGKFELRLARYETTAGLATVTGFAGPFNDLADQIDNVVELNATGANAANPAGIAGFEAFLRSQAGQTYAAAYNTRFTPNPDPSTVATRGSFSDAAVDRRSGQIVATSDLTSKGVEAELVFNPTRSWRISANVGKAEAVRARIDPALKNFVNNVMTPLLLNPDGTPTAVGALRANPSNNETYAQRFTNRVTNVLLPTFLQEGAPTAELRKWRFNAVTTYTFRREGVLKGFAVGGAMRWQDKAVIGFPYVTVNGQAVPDVKNPYHAPERTDFDAWISYGRRIGQRFNWRVQLNVRNIGVGDELIPFAAQPDGSISRYTIAEAQKWTLSNSISF